MLYNKDEKKQFNHEDSFLMMQRSIVTKALDKLAFALSKLHKLY